MKKLKNSPNGFRVGEQLIAVPLSNLKKHAPGIVLLGLADETGIKNVGGRPGAALGPAAIREKLKKLVAPDLSVPLYDLGDLTPSASVEETHRKAASWLKICHAEGHLPIVLGGGHDLAFPEAQALLESHPKDKLGFLNVDAHLDLRAPNEKGITSGSPWYLLLHHPLFRKQKCHLVEFGIQAHCNSPELLETAEKFGVKIHWLPKLEKPVSEFQRVLKALSRGHSAVQVSLDIDSVQSSQAPGCSAPQVLGFSAKEFIRFSELAGAEPKVRSFGIYEVSPPLDFNLHTAALAAQSVLAFIHGVEKRPKKRL